MLRKKFWENRSRWCLCFAFKTDSTDYKPSPIGIWAGRNYGYFPEPSSRGASAKRELSRLRSE